mgnify:CR=1 FL=1
MEDGIMVSLDGERIFDEPGISFEICGDRRARSEKAVAGLDGLLSIDCGHRGREIIQRGRLMGVSRAGL